MVKTLCFHCRERRVQSLIGELKSHMLQGTDKIKVEEVGRRKEAEGCDGGLNQLFL